MKNLTGLSLVSIEEIDEESVYDITVPGNHNFFLNGNILSSNCIIILDESQNVSKEQMKMFLTRIGYGSKMIVDGDLTQCDLPKGTDSGLNWAVNKLAGKIEEIQVIEFSKADIVRNPLIGKMLTYLEGPEHQAPVNAPRGANNSYKPGSLLSA